MPPIKFTYALLVEKCANVDPDLRVMILRDFCDAIRQGTITGFSADEEQKVVDVLAERFSGYERVKDVQSEAMRTLDQACGFLSHAGLHKLTVSIVNSATCAAGTQFKTVTVTGTDVPILRENGCDALRLIITKRMGKELEGAAATAFASAIADPLIAAIAEQQEDTPKRDYYSILQVLLTAMGPAITPATASNLYKQLRSDWACKTPHLFSQLVAVNAALFPILQDDFKNAMGNLISDLNTRGETFSRNLKAFIAVIRTSSSRVGENVPRLFTILNAELDRLEADSDTDNSDNDEARASILDSLKSLVRDCPKEAEPYLDNVLTVATKLSAWDPNYCGDDYADADNANTAADADDGGYGGYGDYAADGDDYGDYYSGEGYAYEADATNDADDLSWKVRLAATSLLTTVIRNASSRKGAEETLTRLLNGSANGNTPLFVKLLKDRVEAVKLEAYDMLVAALEFSSAERTVAFDPSATTQQQTNVGLAYGHDTNVQLTALPAANIFESAQAAIVTLLTAALADKSSKVSAKAADALRKYMLVRDIAVLSLVPTIANDAKALFADEAARRNNAAVVPTVFQLLRFLVVRATRPDAVNLNVANSILALVPQICAACADKTVTTARPAIDLVGEIAVVAPNNAATAFAAVSGLLNNADVEIKAAAVTSAAKILAATEAQVNPADAAATYAALASLLDFDTTRRVASNAIKTVARTKLPAQQAAAYADNLSKVLYRADRQERESAIGSLAAVVAAHPTAVSDATYAAIVAALAESPSSSTTFVERELTISALSFQLAAAVASCGKPTVVGNLVEKVVPRMVEFLTKSGVQGLPVVEAGKTFYAVGRSSDASFAKAFSLTQGAFVADNAGNVPVAFGALIAADADAARRTATLEKVAAKIAEVSEGPRAAAALGEAGRFTSLVAVPAALNGLLATSFKSEDIAAAVTTALAKATSTLQGAATFEKLLAAGATGANYVASRALRTSIAEGAMAAAQHPLSDPNVFSSTLSTLAPAAASDVVEVHEAIGQLATWNRAAVFEKLDGFVKGSSPQLVAAAGYALRYTLRSARSSASAADRDTVTNTCIAFLKLVTRQSDVAVRRNAVILLKAMLAEGFYTEPVHHAAFAAAVAELSVDGSLVKITDLGVVKHRDDRGVDLRRNAFDFIRELLAAREASLLDSSNYAAIAKGTIGALGPVGGVESEEDEDIIVAARKQLVALRRVPAAWSYVVANMADVAKYLGNSLRVKNPKEVDRKEEDAIALAIALMGFLKAQLTADEFQPLAEKYKEAEAHNLAPRARLLVAELTATTTMKRHAPSSA